MDRVSSISSLGMAPKSRTCKACVVVVGQVAIRETSSSSNARYKDRVVLDSNEFCWSRRSGFGDDDDDFVMMILERFVHWGFCMNI